MKPHQIKANVLISILVAVCCLGMAFLFWKPVLLPREKLPTDEYCRMLQKKYSLSFSPEAVRSGAVSLVNLEKPQERVASDPGKTTRHTLPADWNFYLPSDWEHPGIFSISVQKKKWCLTAREYVSFMYPYGYRKPALSLIRLRIRGFGKIIPLVRTYHYFYLNEKEHRLPKEMLADIFFRDHYFLYESDNDSNTVSFGLSVKGMFEISEMEFYAIDDQRLKGTTQLEGTVTAVSQFPDPSKSDYPNCLYSVEMEGKHIQKGPPVPRRLLLLLPAFTDYKPAPNSNLKPGDKLRVSVLPFQNGSEKECSTQQADTLELFDLDRFLVRKIEKIRDFQNQDEISKIYFSEPKDYISPYSNPLNPPVSPAAELARKNDMARDLASVTERLNRVRGNEKAIHEAFSKAWDLRQKKYQTFDKEYVWGRVGQGFFALGRQHEFIRPLSIDGNLEAIREWSLYLKKQGVQFMIVVIPDFRDIAARVLNPDYANYIDCASAEIVRVLLENDVEALYVADALLEQASRYPFLFAYPHDSHPMQGAQEVIADQIANRLEKRFPKEWNPRCAASDFSMEEAFSSTKSVFPEGVDTGLFKPGDPIPCQVVKYKGKPYQENPQDSKLLILGNSFIQTPFPGFKSLAGLLAKRMSCLPQEFSVHARGPSYTIPLELFNHPALYLKDKRACVLSIYQGHLSAYRFVNLKQIDLEKKLLSKKEKTDVLSLPAAKPPEFTGRQRDFLGQWKDALQDAPGAIELSLANAEQWYGIPEILIPEKYQADTGAVFQLELQPYLNAEYTLRINGHSFFLPVAEELVPVRLIYQKTSPGQCLKIEVKANKPGGLFALKQISVYR